MSPSKKIWPLLSRVLVFILLLGFLFGVIRFSAWLMEKDTEEVETPLNLYSKPRSVKTHSRAGSYMKLRNITFRLNSFIHMQVKSLEGEAIPVKPFKAVNFDDINSFAIDIYHGEIFIPVPVMTAIFNRIVFNYPGSTLRNLKMSIIEVNENGKKVRKIRTTGQMKMVVWIAFEMTGRIFLDKEKTLMIMEAERIKTLGNPLAKQIMGAVGLKMSDFMKVAKGRGVTVKGNQILIEPFTIFPPPKIGGYMVELKLMKDSLYIRFSNSHKLKFPALPYRSAKNYMFLYKGDVKFGRLTMVDALIMMVDSDPKDSFDFYLKNYQETLVKGKSLITRDGAVIAIVPDYNDVVGK